MDAGVNAMTETDIMAELIQFAIDCELTRTRKVRRRIIATRYQSLVDALYSERRTGHIETEITFEDGQTGHMRAELAIRNVAATASLPARARPRAR